VGVLLLRMLVGGAAALLAWAIVEPSKPPVLDTLGWSRFEMNLILGLGVAIGASVGGLNGYFQGSRTHLIRGLLMGAVFGAIGATLGYSVGGALVGIVGGVRQNLGPISIITRMIALMPLGIFLGAGIGAASLNARRVVQGAIGGGIGAGLGAGLFDIVGAMVAPVTLAAEGVSPGEMGEVGTVSRAILALLMGSGIALFIGLVERMARQAWLRLSLGRNEGKEWVLDAPQNFIGRSENAHVPLFGDPNVAPMHAVIQRHGGQYVLADAGTQIGTLLNGQRVSQAPLFHGAMITIGGFQLEFLMRHGQAPQRGPEGWVGQHYPVGGGQPATPGVPPQPAPAPIPAAPSMPTQAYPGPMAPTTAMPAATPAGFALVALDGPLTGQRYPVAGPVELGRESAAIPLSFDGAASRRHASVSPGLGGLAVTDLGSTNGTYINGQRVQQGQAGPGDRIRVGSTTFAVEPV
jgi:pSer/pThr/pTyr-binding forkhead associated (FHA) protein